MTENNNVNSVPGYFFFVLLSKQLMNNTKVINQTRMMGGNIASHCFSLHLAEVCPNFGGIDRPHRVRHLSHKRN